MKFILLSHPRSGTSYFCGSILTQHNQIHCYGEIFNNPPGIVKTLDELGMKPFKTDGMITKRLKSLIGLNDDNYELYKTFLNELEEKTNDQKKSEITGFKLFPGQVPDNVMYELLNECKIILLTRNRIELAALSYEIALRTGQWHKTGRNETFKPFKARFGKMMKFIKFYEGKLKVYENYLKENNIKHLRVYYESLYTKETLDNVEIFLDLNKPFNDKNYKNSKLNNPERYKLISNFEVIRKQFINEGYGDLLVDH